MKKLYTHLAWIFLLAGIAGCKSATKLYEKGNYDEAVQVAAKKLQKDPNNKKLQTVIMDAYSYAVNDHESRIRGFAENSNELKYEWMYNEYAQLQAMYDAIFKAPSVYELVNPKDYTSDLNVYADKAAEVHYARGMQWMNNNNGDRQSFKNAYREFQSALYYKPGDINLMQVKDDAYDAALVRVVVVPADEYGFRYSSYGNDAQRFENEVIRDLQYNSGNEFVKFYSAWEAQNKNILADEIVDLHFTQINIGRVRDNYNTKEVSKSIVVKEIVYKPDSVIKEYGTVKAKLITTTRSLYSEGNMAISIRNADNRYLWSDNVRGSHNWSTTFTSYTGDERALSEEDKKMVNQKQERPPSDYDITRCIRESISNDLTCRLRNYYRRY